MWQYNNTDMTHLINDDNDLAEKPKNRKKVSSNCSDALKITSEIINYELRSGLSQEFEIVDLGELYNEFQEKLTKIHRTSFYHIIWFQKGSPIHLVDFNPIQINPNSLLFLNKDVVHRFDKTTGFEGKAILFTDSFFCKNDTDIQFLANSTLFNSLYSSTQFSLDKTRLFFAELFNQMETEAAKIQDSSQAGILQNLLHNFLLYSEREIRPANFSEIKKNPGLDYVMAFKNLLEHAYQSQKQVGYYARHCNLTQKRLNQATTKVLGKSPKAIIDERVMLEAMRILAHTAISIKEIGYELGFKEPTNFIKYFRKHSGLTPTEFREKAASA